VEAIKFGASISTSGRYALQGRQALAGLRAWAEAANAEGGIRRAGMVGKTPVAMVCYDDASSPARAARNAERLLQVDRVGVLIGPYASDLTRAVLPIARHHGKLLWNHGGASDDIHHRGARVVGIPTPASRYFGGLLAMMRQIDPEAKRAVLCYRRDSGFGRLAAEGAQAAADETGVILTVYPYSSVRDDLPQLLTMLAEQRPHLVLSAGSFVDDCTIAREVAAARLGAKACGFVGAAMEEFGQALGADAEGLLGPSQWEPAPAYLPDWGPSRAEAAERIQAKGAAADYPAAQAYAACLIAQRCLEEAEGGNESDLWQAACAQDCTTFFGRFRIDWSTGLQVGHEMVWVQWRGGRKVVVWPPHLAETAPAYSKT